MKACIWMHSSNIALVESTCQKMGKLERLCPYICCIWLEVQIAFSGYRQFQQDTTFDNLSCSGMLLWTIHSVPSELYCAVLCFSRKECINFFYNSELHSCEGRTDSLCKTDACTSSTGQEYYRSNGVDPNMQDYQYTYVYIEEFKSCLKEYGGANMTTASAQCATDGGHLVTITSQEMLDKILALLEPLHPWGHMHWLIDGRKARGEWVDWEDKSLNVTSWVWEYHTGFPPGNCLRLHGGTVRGIGPSECDLDSSEFICQID